MSGSDDHYCHKDQQTASETQTSFLRWHNHLQEEVKNSTYSQTYPNKSHLLCDLMASGFTLTHKSWSQALENASNYTNQYVFIDCLQSASCHTQCCKSQLPNVRPQPSTALTQSGLINNQALSLVATMAITWCWRAWQSGPCLPFRTLLLVLIFLYSYCPTIS